MNERTFNERDALNETGDARPNLDGVHGLEVSREFVFIGDSPRDRGCDRHLAWRGRGLGLTAASEESADSECRRGGVQF
jgi:hypothetical protein